MASAAITSHEEKRVPFSRTSRFQPDYHLTLRVAAGIVHGNKGKRTKKRSVAESCRKRLEFTGCEIPSDEANVKPALELSAMSDRIPNALSKRVGILYLDMPIKVVPRNPSPSFYKDGWGFYIHFKEGFGLCPKNGIYWRWFDG